MILLLLLRKSCWSNSCSQCQTYDRLCNSSKFMLIWMRSFLFIKGMPLWFQSWQWWTEHIITHFKLFQQLIILSGIISHYCLCLMLSSSYSSSLNAYICWTERPSTITSLCNVVSFRPQKQWSFKIFCSISFKSFANPSIFIINLLSPTC